MRELWECKWVSVCAKTSPEGDTVRSETHRGTYSAVHVLARAQHTHIHTQWRVSTLVKLGYTPDYAVQGFSWVSNDLAVTTFLLELESRGFRVRYIRLNGLQVHSSTVSTCLKQHFSISSMVWCSASHYAVIVLYTVYYGVSVITKSAVLCVETRTLFAGHIKFVLRVAPLCSCLRC